MARTCILVTGMHRSGTSATAGALGLCGVAMGSALLAPGADNPKGYFEHERAVAINERLLLQLGSRWDDVRALPGGWQDSAAAREAQAAIEAFVADEFADAPLWALKDPRLCRLMPLWLAALRKAGVQPVVLFVARDPAEVAASIEARNGWAPALSGIAWLRHMLEAETASRDLPRTAIAYDALLADPATSLVAALARLDVALPQRPDEPALRRFVDAGDRHQRREALPRQGGPFASIIDHVHAALLQVAAGEDAWVSIRAANEAFAREWDAVGAGIDAVAGMAAAFNAETRGARAEARQVRSELNAQLDWARQAVGKEEKLQADNARLGSDLAAQLAWSERAVAEREALQADNARLQSELTAQVRWSEQAVADWQARATTYEQALAERDASLAAIHHSLAWHLSLPLRAIEAAARKLLKRK